MRKIKENKMRTVNVVPSVLIVFFVIVCIVEICYSAKKKLPFNNFQQACACVYRFLRAYVNRSFGKTNGIN